MNEEFRDRVLFRLNQNDYVKDLHEKIKKSLVGCMFNDYSGKEPSKQYLLEGGIFAPNFHAVVDMLTAHLIYEMTGKLLDRVLEEIDEVRNIIAYEDLYENVKEDK